MRFLPKTKLGKWAVGLIALWPVMTILGSLLASGFYAGIEAGSGIIDDLHARPFLAIAMLLGITGGLVAFVIDLVAILKKGERSFLAFFSALIGLFLVMLLIGEFFVEH